MPWINYRCPVALSKLGENETSREAQDIRAIKWLLAQEGAAVVVVTPKRQFNGKALNALISRPGVYHYIWRGFSAGFLEGTRALVAWPDRKHLNELWDAGADALAVIEWNEEVTAEWAEAANPTLLLPGKVIESKPADVGAVGLESLPNNIDRILEYVASMAAGYSSGLKWDEEDKLRADMMNRPERWWDVTVEQVRAKCRALGMRPDDVDTIADFVQRRKEGRRFNVRSSYRDFQFN